MSERKTNSNAWENQLSEEVQHECYELLREFGYQKGRILIAKEYDVRPSIGALARFYKDRSEQETEAELIRIATDMSNVEELTAKLDGVDEALRAKLNQAAYAALMGGDPSQIKLLVGLALKAGDSEREDAKLKQRIAEFDRKMQAAGETLDDGKLSPEEKELRIREVLGL